LEWDNVGPVLQGTRCLRSLPTTDGGVTVEFNLETCRFLPTTEEVRRTRVALGPDALPPMPPRPAHPTWTSAGPSTNSGRGSLATCGDVEPNPGPGHTEQAGVPHQVLPLDTALTAPCIGGLFALKLDAPGHALWWCARCGMSWRAPKAAATCPDGCAPIARTPLRGHHSWLRHRQLVIGKRSPEYQALRGAGLIDAGTSTPRIDDPCAGWEWSRQYHTWRRLLHRLTMVLALHSPCPPGRTAPDRRVRGRCVSCPARLGSRSSCRGASLLSCGDVGANPGPPPTDWGEEDYAVVPDLMAEACGRLGFFPVRDAFATPANHRFPAYCTREDDSFAQPWDYATAGPLWASPPFSRLDEVVTKAAREGCLMLVIAPEWPGPQYQWWAALCALCPKRWQLPQDWPLYIRGVTDLIPAPRWRTWAFLLDSREGSQTRMPPPPPLILPQTSAPRSRRRPGPRTRVHNS